MFCKDNDGIYVLQHFFLVLWLMFCLLSLVYGIFELCSGVDVSVKGSWFVSVPVNLLDVKVGKEEEGVTNNEKGGGGGENRNKNKNNKKNKKKRMEYPLTNMQMSLYCISMVCHLLIVLPMVILHH